MRRLDSILDNDSIAVPQYCKIDTQGYEYPILVGLGDYFPKVDVFLVEVNRITFTRM